MARSPSRPQAVAAPQRAFTRPITSLLLAQLFIGTLLAPAFTFFPVYLQDLGFPAVTISLLVALQRVSGFATSLAGGTLLDRLGSKRSIILGETCLLVGTLVFAARGTPAIALIWAVSGIGLALNSLAGQSYLLEHARPASLGVLAALLAWGSTLGATIGNPLSGVLLARADYRILTSVAVIPAVATVAFAALALPGGRGAEPRQAAAPQNRVLGLVRSLALAGQPAVRPLAGMRLLATFCYGMALVFVPLQLRAAGASNQLIAAYAATSNVVASAAQLLVGRIADRVTWRAPTLVACLTLSASSLAVGLFGRSVPAVFAGATAAIAAAWSLSTLLPTHVSRASNPAERPKTLGLLQLTWYAAMIASGLVGGVLYEAWHGLPMTVGACAAALLFPAARVFFKRVREK